MSRFKSQFLNDNYAVMRHARPYANFEGSKLEERSVTICRKVVDEFAAMIHGKNVNIFHSPFSRARLTAEVVKEQLTIREIGVSGLSSVGWLRDERGGLTNSNIKDVLSSDTNTFVLFIAHMLQIEFFLEEEYESANCTIIAAQFIISGDR